ncbi:MAG: VOC family protein [Pseudomonadota bacterium]
MRLTPFHLAIPVRDIDEARHFYGELLGFPEGRSADYWIDFDMFGHQLVTHLDEDMAAAPIVHNPVDGHEIPIPHFGVVLSIAAWEALRVRVEGFVEEFVVEPYVRFAGEPGEQRTMFFLDPSGNALEFKAFADIESQLFATD